MGADSKIQWTHHTFNPWWGCVKVSPACKNCYAESFAKRTGHAVWGGSERRFFGVKHWVEPIKWNEAAAAAGERRRVFCASMADVFEHIAFGHKIEDERIRLWELIDHTPNLDWLLLTKRPHNVMSMVPSRWLPRFPGNVWIGATVESQNLASERLPELLRVPARVRFLSCEPLLGALQLDVVNIGDFSSLNALTGEMSYSGLGGMPGHTTQRYSRGVDWVIVGGESGGGARDFGLPWARALVQQGARYGVPVFMKQLGAVASDWTPGDGTDRDLVQLKSRKGDDLQEWPAELRVRQFPEVSRG